MATLVHYLESVFIILIHKFFPYHTPNHFFRGPTLSRGECVTYLLCDIEHLIVFPTSSYDQLCATPFLNFQNKHLAARTLLA